MNEADWKRALVKSCIKQGGVAFRIEDRYAVGRPDLYIHALDLPPFLLEAKIVHGAKLVCTAIQEERLKDLNRPPHAFACIIGLKDDKMYLGAPHQPLAGCLFEMRPSRLDSNDWAISELLRKHVDRILSVH